MMYVIEIFGRCKQQNKQMSKEEIKRELDYLRDKRARNGWRDGDSEKYEELLRMWDNCAHIGANGRYVKDNTYR